MGTKFLAGLTQKLRSLANQSQQKQGVEEENEKTNFRVGLEYDAEQITVGDNTFQICEEKVTALKNETLKGKPTREEINYYCTSAYDDCSIAIASELHLKENQESQLKIQQNFHNEKHIEASYKAQKDHHVTKEQKNIERKHRHLNKHKTNLGYIKDEILLKKDQLNSYLNPPLARGLFNNVFLYFILLGFFTVGDAVLSFNAMSLLAEGVSNLGLITLTILASIGVAIGADFTGSALANHGVSKQFFLAFLISMLFVCVLIWLRIVVGASLILSLLSLAFYLIACLIAYKHSLSNVYWSVYSRLELLKKRKSSFESEILFQEKALKADNEALLSSVRHLVEEEVVKDTLFNKLKEKNLTNASLGLNKVLVGYSTRIDTIRKHALAELAVREERAKINSFRVYDFGLSTALKSMFTVMAFVFLMSCSHDVEQTTTMALLDLTASGNSLPDSKSILSHISMDAGQVILSAISDVHAYPYQTIFLPAPKPFLAQVKEEEDMRIVNFEKRFESAYNALPLPLENLNQSLVFSALAQSFKALSKTKNGKHRLLIYSDLIQYEATGINFYDYAENPRKLITDYDEILEAFRTEYDPEKQLFVGGLEVVIYYSPTKGTDQLWRFQQKFYERFFMEFGAVSVEFLPFYIAPDNTISQMN